MSTDIRARLVAALGPSSDEVLAIMRLVNAAADVVSSDGGMDRYDHEEDEVGCRSCCGVVSYRPHESDCWVVRCREALIPFS